MNQNTLTSKTFSKACQLEVVKLLPTAKYFKKLHVAGVGYVHFVYDASKTKIGQCFKESKKGMVLNILN